MSNIKALFLNGTCGRYDELCQSIATHCPNLEVLSFPKSTNEDLSANKLKLLTNNCKKLKVKYMPFFFWKKNLLFFFCAQTVYGVWKKLVIQKLTYLKKTKYIGSLHNM